MPDNRGGQEGVRARLRLTPPFRDLLRAVVQRAQGAVAADPKLAQGLGFVEKTDPELLAALELELREGGAEEARPEFGSAEILLEVEEAEAAIRGSVQVRLRLHETVLQQRSSEELEDARQFFKLSPIEQQGYACYRILAHLEEDLLAQLNGDGQAAQ
jgi:hypothetical protein